MQLLSQQPIFQVVSVLTTITLIVVLAVLELSPALARRQAWIFGLLIGLLSAAMVLEAMVGRR